MNNKKFVIKVSKSGRSALSDNLDSYTFHTDRMVAKIYTKGDPKHSDTLYYRFATQPPTGITNLFKIPHGYDYTPAVLGLASMDGYMFFKTPFVHALDLETESIAILEVYTDSMYLYIDLVRRGSIYNYSEIYIKYNITDMVGMA